MTKKVYTEADSRRIDDKRRAKHCTEHQDACACQHYHIMKLLHRAYLLLDGEPPTLERALRKELEYWGWL